MIGRKIGEIFETRDYSMFKIMKWNREVTMKRAQKIRDSIKRNGYILNPICVNEHFEVIDGQGRLEALRLLGLPVHYYVEVGAGKAECIALNSYNTLWSVRDYIASYANTGNDNYMRLNSLMDEYKVFGLGTVYFAATGTASLQNDVIKHGNVKCSAEMYNEAQRRLEALKKFIPGVQKLQGNQSKAYQAIYFALGCEGVNATKLQERLEAKYSIAPAISNMKQALDALTDIYNFNARQDRVYLAEAYDKFMRGKYTWYENKWGDA